MPTKRLPTGICDHCECQFPTSVSLYTRRGPRLYCCTDCRNAANARAGNALRTAKLRARVAEGRWQNPHHLHPPTGAEQAARARKGRLREVAEGRWRNPALADAARTKLSRPRAHADDPLLHRVLERLSAGARTADLTDEEHARFLAYRRALRQARIAEVRAYYRARYRRMVDAADSDARERLRARWRQQNCRQTANRQEPA